MKLRTQLFLGYIVVFTIMILVGGYMCLNVISLINTHRWVEQSIEVRIKARLLQGLVIDMQSAKRGFQLTGDEALLEPYNEATGQYEKEMFRLKGLVSNEPQQVDRLEKIEALIARFQNTVVSPQIEERRRFAEGTLGMAEVIDSVRKGTGEDIINELRDKLDAFIGVERNQLAERENAARRSIYVFVFGTLLAVSVGIAAMLSSLRLIMRQVGGEPAAIMRIANQIAGGNLDIDLGEEPEKSTGIRASISTMLVALRGNKQQTERQDWLKTGIGRLNELVRGDPEVEVLASNVIAEMIGAQRGKRWVPR